MARFGVALLGLVLVATAARAQTLGEVGAAMGVHDAAAGTAAPSGAALRSRLQGAGSPTASPNPIQILSDYGKRVATEQAAKSGGKNAWAAAGELGGSHGGKSQSWETAGAGGHGGTGNNAAWAKNDKGSPRATSRRR